MSRANKFRKAERLCSQKEIQSLFDIGNSFYMRPFRMQWAISDKQNNYPAKIAISVPKKLFHKAVDRNLIRRRIKESYRQNKSILYEKLNHLEINVIFMLIYTGKDIPEYVGINEKIIQLIYRFEKEIAKENEVS